MAIDIAATSDGDIKIENGDITLTGSNPESVRAQAVEIAQRVYFALKTEAGDFLLHDEIGHRMTDMLGLPNNPTTADYGKKLILQALASVRITTGITIETWPGPEFNKINYEIKVSFGATPSVLTFTISSLITG